VLLKDNSLITDPKSRTVLYHWDQTEMPVRRHSGGALSWFPQDRMSDMEPVGLGLASENHFIPF
jgi:hypothetical protein